MRVLYDPSVDPPEADPTYQPAQAERQTGIRRVNGGWIAVRNGRLVSEHTGLGCKAAAIRAAGTNRVIT